MAYDAQGHKITSYRGQTGYWSDPAESDDGEAYFIPAKAVSSASGTPSTAMQVVNWLNDNGIDVNNATAEQLTVARAAIGKPVEAPKVSATSGGMAADTREIVQADDGNYYRYSPETGLDMSKPVDMAAEAAAKVPEGYTRLGDVMNSPQGIIGNVYKDKAGKFYLDESTNPNNYGFGKPEPTGFREIPWNAQQVEAELGARATARAEQQADENPADDSFMSFITSPGSMAVLAGFGAVLGVAGAFGAASGGLAPTATTEVLAADGGMFGLPTATSAGGVSATTVGAEAATAGTGLINTATDSWNFNPESISTAPGDPNYLPSTDVQDFSAPGTQPSVQPGDPNYLPDTDPANYQLDPNGPQPYNTPSPGDPDYLPDTDPANYEVDPNGPLPGTTVTPPGLLEKGLLEVGKGLIKTGIKDWFTDDPTTPAGGPGTTAAPPRENEVGELSFGDVLLVNRAAPMLPGWNT